MKVTSFIMGLGFIACFILQANAAIADDRHYDKNENFMIGAAVGGNDTWYVDGATGSDTTGDGSEASPWQTIGKALDRYRSALTMGDHIRIKAGVYNERLTIANLGGTASEQNRFVIGPYGDGEVIINPTDTHLLNWTAYNSTIYRTSYSFGTPDSIVMDDSFKSSRPVYALADCVADGQWYWDSAASMLYVHTSGQDPVTQRDILVRKLDENNTRFGIYVETEDYVTIYGLTILGAPSIGIYANGSHIKVEKCKIKYCGKNAITPGTFLEVNKCYLYANCMMNWPRGKRWGSNGGWPTAVNIGDGGSITGSIVAETGGEGINRYGGDSSAILIEDNIVYNNWSINIYVDNHPNATIRRNLIFCSGINFDDVIDVAHIPAGSTEETVRRRLRGTGIGLGDETQAHAVATSENHNIYNNIIIACRYGFDHYNQASGSGWKNFSIYNNLIILPDYDSALVNDTFYGFRVRNPGSNVATNIKNNIVIGNHSSGYLVDYLTSSQTDSGIIWDNNLWYHDNNALPFKYKTAAVNFTSWVGAVTNGDNSLNEDPQLEMTVFSNWSQQGYNEDTVSIADFHPQDTSPCFNGGEDLSSLFTTDYNSNLRSGWTIGAFEGSLSPDTTLPATIANLSAASGTDNGEADLTWTAPGDDGATGTVNSYDVRYSTASINDSNWASATQASGEPSPSAAGSAESMTVSGLTPGQTYYFAIKSQDEVPNVSALSNVASAQAKETVVVPDTTPPYTTGHSPAKSATNIAPNTPIIVQVKDDGAGVDINTIVMRVNSQIVTPTITGTPADYTLTYEPPADFNYGVQVNIEVQASDLAP